MTDNKLNDERARLAALRRYRILDTGYEDTFENVVQILKQVFDVPIVAVSLVDADRQWFKARCGLDDRQTPRDISFCTHAILVREPMMITDAASHPMFRTNPLVTGAPHIRSYLGAQLRSPDGYHIGTVCVIDTRPRAYEPAQITVLEHFARLVVSELEVRLIAAADDLTGARSRAGMMDQIEKEMERGRQSGGPSALVMADLDHFAALNDTLGVEVGDMVLRSFATLCTERMRESEALGRMGGEEFAMLLLETTGAQAVALVERVRHALRQLDAPELEGRRVTASFGLAERRDADATPAEWLARAEKAMLQAKATGRNRVVLTEAESVESPPA